MSPETTAATSQAGVQTLYDRLIGAWNRRDARGFAECFLPDGNTIGFDGSQIDGAEAIAKNLAGIFGNHPTASYVTLVREVRELAPEVGLLRAVAGMLPPGSNTIKADVNAIQSLVAVHDGNDWRVALFQNTPAAFHGRPADSAALTRELQRAADHHWSSKAAQQL